MSIFNWDNTSVFVFFVCLDVSYYYGHDVIGGKKTRM